MLRQWIKAQLLRRGAILSRPPGQFNLVNFKIRQAQARGLEFKRIVDGGAAEGDWTRDIKTIYPGASVLCVEPRQDAQSALEKLCLELPGVSVAQALLGPNDCETVFYESGHRSSVLKELDSRQTATQVRVRQACLDNLVEERGFGQPDFIKLDLQGAELSALEGAAKCLKFAQALQLEVSLLPYSEHMPLLADVLAFMKARGFVSYDILALAHRPLDGAMIQCDILFLREDHPLRRDCRWDGVGS